MEENKLLPGDVYVFLHEHREGGADTCNSAVAKSVHVLRRGHGWRR